MFAKMCESFVIFFGLLLNFLTFVHGKHVRHPQSHGQETCGLTDHHGINTFVLDSATSPIGPIPLIHIQFDTERQLPVTSTVVYNELNHIKNASRGDNFREVDCGNLHGKQQKCSRTMRMTDEQKHKVNFTYTSWDRGHLTPVSPMKFSNDAQDVTFYCVNIAPQEPWSNRCSWYAVEERTLSYSKTIPSFVITGVCTGDNTWDGKTHYDQIVPECFWKMTCYVDSTSDKVHVVAFVSNNSLVPAETLDDERKHRWVETITPLSQQSVLNMMGSKAGLISNAWIAAEETLTKGRTSSKWPTASHCEKSKHLSKELEKEWEHFMKDHRPVGICKKTSHSLTSNH